MHNLKFLQDMHVILVHIQFMPMHMHTHLQHKLYSPTAHTVAPIRIHLRHTRVML